MPKRIAPYARYAASADPSSTFASSSQPWQPADESSAREMRNVKHNLANIASLAPLLFLCACAGQRVASGGPGGAPHKLSHPGLATSQAVFLKVYRGTTKGLLVSGLYPDAPVDPDRDPGTVLHGLTFTADPSVHGSYFWPFAEGVTFLDGTCQKTNKEGLLADAARTGGISVQFVTFLYAD
jgi:hypothetical protein